MSEIAHNSEDLLGSVFNGQYIPKELLGETGKHWIFKAEDVLLNRNVSLKVLKSNLEERILQDIQESYNLSKLGKHSNITTIYGRGVDHGHSYLALEYLEGESLDKMLSSAEAIQEEDVLEFAKIVVNVLAYAHAKGVYHVDLKPENILRVRDTKSGKLKWNFNIIDWGGKKSEDIALETLNLPQDKIVFQKRKKDIEGLGSLVYSIISDSEKKGVKFHSGFKDMMNDSGSKYGSAEELLLKINSFMGRRNFIKIVAIGSFSIAMAAGSFFSAIKFGEFLEYDASIQKKMHDISESDQNDYAHMDKLFRELASRVVQDKILPLVKDERYVSGMFPYATGLDGKWFSTSGGYWTEGFWPGLLWLCAFYEDNSFLKAAADKIVSSMKFMKNDEYNVSSFRFLHSCGLPYELFGIPEMNERAVLAASKIYSIFDKYSGFLGMGNYVLTESTKIFKTESLKFLPLFWHGYRYGANEEGKEKFYEAINSHLNSALRYSVREDFSVRDRVVVDVINKGIVQELSHYSFNEDSTYSRGQAWLVWSFLEAYGNGMNEFLDPAIRAADKYIDLLSSSSEDYVPFYDFNSVEKKKPKDASASVIMLEPLRLLYSITCNQKYRDYFYNSLKSIASERYLSHSEEFQGIVMHCCESKNTNEYTDSALIYSDFFFMKALFELGKNKNIK